MMFLSLGIGTVVALALITVVSLLTGGTVHGNTPPTNALVGQRVAAFDLPGLTGGRVVAPWKTGRPTVVIFFASWCTPCQGELPKVAAYLDAHPTSRVNVVGMDANDSRSSGLAFATRAAFHRPIAFDANGNVTAGSFGFQVLPETVFVSGTGVVRQVYIGAITVPQLRAGIAAL
jgi:thiol-disulfide isomerase/thioredoxin